MTTTQSLTERRRLLGRVASNLLQQNRPLTAAERINLTQLHREIDDLENELRSHADQKYKEAWRSWLRFGLNRTLKQPGVSAEARAILESRDMGAGSGAAYPGSQVGFFVPLEFEQQVTSAMRFAGPMLDITNVVKTDSGAPRAYPSDNDTSAIGAQLIEGQQTPALDIQNVAETFLKAYKYSSGLIKISNELSTDAGFDIEAYLSERLGIRLGRILNYALMVGSGDGQPTGLLNAGLSVGRVATGSGSNTGGADPLNTIGSDDLNALEMSVDYSYRSRSSYLLHDATLQAIRSLKDKKGLPLHLFKSAAENPAGIDTLNGKPVYITPYMPQLPATPSSPPVQTTTVLFGDFSKYVVRRTGLAVIRLEERFSDYAQTAFVSFVRVDANLLDGGGGAIKQLVNSY